MSVESTHEDAIKKLKSEFFKEFQQVQKYVHNLINDLTAISGYAQLLQLKPERSLVEAHKIIGTVEKCTQMLRCCIENLRELERRYS